MKKILYLMLIGSLLFGMTTTSAAKKKAKKRTQRVVVMTYDRPSAGVIGPEPVMIGSPVGAPGGQQIPVMPNERYIKIEVTDTSGQKVAGRIAQVSYSTFGPFCGAHTKPVKLRDTSPILGIYAFNGTCQDGTPSVMTTGKIRITLSNVP